MEVREGNALHELPKMPDKSFDLICSGLWPNPTPEGLALIARETVRIARKGVFLQTVRQDECVDLIVLFRNLGYYAKMMPAFKIQQTREGNATQWQLLVKMPGIIRVPVKLPFDRPYSEHIDKKGAMTGNALVNAQLPSYHRSNPDGTRDSSMRDWMPTYAPRKSQLVNQPSQPLSIPLQVILEITNAGDSVLDFSCGSGTNLVAAKMLFRAGTGIDINPEHVRITIDRISEVKVSSLQEGKKLAIEEMMEPLRRFSRWAPPKKRK